MSQQALLKRIIISKILLFIGSCFYICSMLENIYFCIDMHCEKTFGWLLLIFGIFGIELSPANRTWLANPILFASWFILLLNYNTKRKIIGFIGIILSATSFIVGLSFSTMNLIVSDESGVPRHITGLGVGYWLWLLSMAASSLSAICQYIELSRIKTQNSL